MKFLFSSLLVLFVVLSVHGQEPTIAHKDSLNRLVEQYYQLSLKIYRKDSQPKDINKLFDLFTEDFEYIHPKYGGIYTREDLYDGYLRNQKNGAYDGSIVDLIVKNKIIGLNAVATDRAYLKKVQNGKPQEVDRGMTVFEFKHGKISRIYEYW